MKLTKKINSLSLLFLFFLLVQCSGTGSKIIPSVSSSNSGNNTNLFFVREGGYVAGGVLAKLEVNGTEIAKFCHAFVHFDGQGSGSTRTIRDDFNVSSVDDLAVGFYQVNFANNMADANYSALVTGDVRSPNNRLTGTDCNDYTTSSFRISSADVTSQFGNGRADTKVVTVAVFGTT